MTCLTSSFRDTKCTRNGVGGAKEVQNLMLCTFVSALHAVFFPKRYSYEIIHSCQTGKLITINATEHTQNYKITFCDGTRLLGMTAKINGHFMNHIK